MHKVNLHVEPEQPPMAKEVFIRDMPPFSVALDGYVYGAPFFDPTGPRSNFNHHEEVDRSATGATCEQVLDAIREGFYKNTYRDSNGRRADIYVNDCDQDVCLSVFLLMHPELAESTTNPVLNRLVSVEGKLDASAGSYPINPDFRIMSQIAWIFKPYTQFRSSGGLDNKKDVAGFEAVIEQVGERIHKHLMGEGQEIPLDTSYEIIDSRKGYVVVREIGEHARIKMFSEGIGSFLAVGSQEPGSSRYTVGRRSVYIPFPVEDIFAVLNGADPNVDQGNNWSGGNLIGGSPRATGSGLNLDEVTKLIDQTMLAKKL